MTGGGQLDADGVRALFHELSDRLVAAGVSAQLFVVGGAAMTLAYDRDHLTRDLDDAALLFNRLGYTTAQQCIDLLTATYPTGQLLSRHRYIAEDIAARAQARRDAQNPDPAKRRL